MYYHIISLLHVSAHQRRHLQGVHYEAAELLPNVVKAKTVKLSGNGNYILLPHAFLLYLILPAYFIL
jgi:hypothetical protein